MYKITDKRFLKYIDLTKKDIEEIGSTEFATELKNMLKTNTLIESDIQTLFLHIVYTIDHPEYYIRELKAALSNSSNFSNSLKCITEFEKEQEYMNQYIRQFNSIKDSIKNSRLSNSLTEIDFSIKNDSILFTVNGNKIKYINMVEFYIDNYQINCCGSYMFIRDIRTEKQYMYYGN